MGASTRWPVGLVVIAGIVWACDAAAPTMSAFNDRGRTVGAVSAAPLFTATIPLACTALGFTGPVALDHVFTGTADNDTFKAPEHDSQPWLIIGTGGKDKLTGGDGNDCILGGDGDDTIKGGKGNDAISGDIGDDSLKGGAGNDSITGGPGKDKLWGDTGADRLDGGTGDDTIQGGSGDDAIDGGPNTDQCNGSSGANTIVNCESPCEDDHHGDEDDDDDHDHGHDGPDRRSAAPPVVTGGQLPAAGASSGRTTLDAPVATPTPVTPVTTPTSTPVSPTRTPTPTPRATSTPRTGPGGGLLWPTPNR